MVFDMMIVVKNLIKGVWELIVFCIGDQEFCVDIMIVCEICGWMKVMFMLYLLYYMMGVINFCGVVLLIVDFFFCFGMKFVEFNFCYVIIVVQICDKIVGLFVDVVFDIFGIIDDKIQLIFEVFVEFVCVFVCGIIVVEGCMICLFEFDGFVQGNESEVV